MNERIRFPKRSALRQCRMHAGQQKFRHFLSRVVEIPTFLVEYHQMQDVGSLY